MAQAKENVALRTLAALGKHLPAVKKPEGHVHFRNKLLWTGAALLAYTTIASVRTIGADSVSNTPIGPIGVLIMPVPGAIGVFGVAAWATGAGILWAMGRAGLLRSDSSAQTPYAIRALRDWILPILFTVLCAFGLWWRCDCDIGPWPLLSLPQFIVGTLLVVQLISVVNRWCLLWRK